MLKLKCKPCLRKTCVSTCCSFSLSNLKYDTNSLLLQHRLSKPRLPLSMLHKKYTLKIYRFYQALKNPPLSYYRCRTLVLQVSHVSICEACQLDLSVYVARLHHLGYQVLVL